MGIIISEVNNVRYLHSISHSPINITPFTNPSAIQDCTYTMTHGKIVWSEKEFKLDVEYIDFDPYKDFTVVDRVRRIHENNLVYDDLTYVSNKQYLKYSRYKKLKHLKHEEIQKEK
jgi:hypothetical protein